MKDSSARRFARITFSIPIRLYRILLSPILPASCIYRPTCSQYAIEAIMKHGIFKGTALATGRLTRCIGGLFTGGEDPVPESFSLRDIGKRYREHWSSHQKQKSSRPNKPQ